MNSKIRSDSFNLGNSGNRSPIMQEEDFIERLSEESQDGPGYPHPTEVSGRGVAAIHALAHHNTRKRFDSADYFEVLETANRRQNHQHRAISDDEYVINEAKIADRQLHASSGQFLSQINAAVAAQRRIELNPSSSRSTPPIPLVGPYSTGTDFTSGTTSEDDFNSEVDLDADTFQRVVVSDDEEEDEEDRFARYETAVQRHNLYARHALENPKRLQRFDSADYWTEQAMLERNGRRATATEPLLIDPSRQIRVSEHDVAMHAINTPRQRLQRFDSADYFTEMALKESAEPNLLREQQDSPPMHGGIPIPIGTGTSTGVGVGLSVSPRGTSPMIFGSPDTRVHQFLAQRAIADKGRPRARSNSSKRPPMPLASPPPRHPIVRFGTSPGGPK